MRPKHWAETFLRCIRKYSAIVVGGQNSPSAWGNALRPVLRDMTLHGADAASKSRFFPPNIVPSILGARLPSRTARYAICSLDTLGHLKQLFGCSFGFVVTAAAQPHKYLLPI